MTCDSNIVHSLVVLIRLLLLLGICIRSLIDSISIYISQSIELRGRRSTIRPQRRSVDSVAVIGDENDRDRKGDEGYSIVM